MMLIVSACAAWCAEALMLIVSACAAWCADDCMGSVEMDGVGPSDLLGERIPTDETLSSLDAGLPFPNMLSQAESQVKSLLPKTFVNTRVHFNCITFVICDIYIY
jgi:hypothetical protein